MTSLLFFMKLKQSLSVDIYLAFSDNLLSSYVGFSFCLLKLTIPMLVSC